MTSSKPQGGQLDPRTGRPWGDHGTANQAIEYVLSPRVDLGCPAEEFLKHWQQGNLGEWPEYYVWLKQEYPTPRNLKPGKPGALPWEK